MSKPGRIVLRDQTTGEITTLVATVFLVNTRDATGPKLCTRIADDGEIHLAGGEEFLVAWVDEKALWGKGQEPLPPPAPEQG